MDFLGGFAVMICILGFLVTVILLIMPFLLFVIKSRVDRTHEMVAGLEGRLAAMEQQLAELKNCRSTSTGARDEEKIDL